MKRSRILLAGLGFSLSALVCAFAGAQTDQIVAGPEPAHVRKADRRPMPFSPGSETRGTAAAVEFLSYDRMSPQDRALAEDAESTVAERAGFEGLEFNQGKWNERQIVCSALAGHLFLQFMRNSGTGDVSVFSASIPRDGNGRVRAHQRADHLGLQSYPRRRAAGRIPGLAGDRTLLRRPGG
jgi:hypothetical protein